MLAEAANTIWPLVRLLAGLGAGLLLGNLLEAMGWSRKIGSLAAPLTRMAHMGEESGASFALAFASPAAANGLLAELYDTAKIRGRELMVANLLNSLPAYLTHAPAIFMLMWPAIGDAALIYLGLTLMAAALRAIFAITLGALALPSPAPTPRALHKPEPPLPERLRAGLSQAWRRFLRRLPKLVLFTTPCYFLMRLGQYLGFFQWLEEWLRANLAWGALINPQALGIVALQLAAELGATLGAAGAAMQSGGLDARDIVLAMLIGNLLATPIRAIRHQLPAYVGYYRPRLAVKLVLANQSLRAASMACVILLYWGMEL